MNLRFTGDPLASPEPLIRRVYSYVAYRLGDGPEAEDVTSEVFERALRYRKSYDRSKGEPVTWLLGIARRCTDTALTARSRDAQQIEDAVDCYSLEQGDFDAEDRSVRRLTLGVALARLGDRDRDLIALRYGSDLTAAQIAQLMDATPNAIEVALHRALGRLRLILESDEIETPGPERRPRTTAG